MEAIEVEFQCASPRSGTSDEARTGLKVAWARTSEEIRAAQRLRHEVFAREMGATLKTPAGTPEGLDVDVFDAYCEHLLVTTEPRDDEPVQVVGTYRLMLPQAAGRLGRYYSETEFNLEALNPIRPRMAELGRSCIAAPWRTGGVILMLWTHLLKFLQANQVEYAMGCASIPMTDGGQNAARLWRQAQAQHLSDPALRVQPRQPLPVRWLDSEGPAQWPPLIKGYLRCGAKVMGAPAWDADFGTADLPMLMDLRSMASSYRRRFQPYSEPDPQPS